jgi:VWFA-related protein
MMSRSDPSMHIPARASTTARLGTLSAILLCVVAHAGAQQPDPRFRVDSELVVVDLVALDRRAEFVADLQPSEIEVLENGQRREIRFVQLVRRRGAASAAPAGSAAAPAAPATLPGDPRAAETDPVRLTIVVDLMTTTPEDMIRVKDAVTRMVTEELEQATEVMMATLWHGLTVVQPFTTDRVRLRDAIQGLQGRNADTVGLASIVDLAQRSCAMTGFPPMPQLVSMAKSMIAESRQQFEAASSTLGGLSRAMAALPGRKHVVLYTRGYALDATAHAIDMIGAAGAACGLDPVAVGRTAASELTAVASFDAVGPLRAMADQANRAQVAFYPIDPRGLVVTGPQAKDAITAGGVRGGAALKASAADTVLPQEFLRVVAGDTGGRAFLNTNDLARGLRRAWADASEYYLIGYVPAPGRKTGAFQRIEVKTGRPDLSLFYRRGYYEATDRERTTADVEQAMREPGAFAHTGLEVEAIVDRGKLRVVAFIPPAVLAFTPSGGQHAGAVSLHASLRDERGRLVGGKPLFGRDVGLKLNDQQLAGLRGSDNLEVPVEVAAPPAGTYQLVLVARDSGGWIGAQALTLVVR